VQTITLLTDDYWCVLFNYYEHVKEQEMLREEFVENQSQTVCSYTLENGIVINFSITYGCIN